jgi:glutamate decarboxylase
MSGAPTVKTSSTCPVPLHERVSSLLHDYLRSLSDRSLPVVDFSSPDELKDVFENVGVKCQFEKENEPSHSDDLLMEAIKVILHKSVRTGHPQFFNQLYGRVNLVSLAGDWISTATNTNGHTFEAAPVATVLEKEILEKFANVVGGKYLNNGHNGLLVPGGSISNLYAMHVARHYADPDISTRGHYGGPRLIAYCSSSAHYSYLKTSRLIGLGSDNLRIIACSAITGAMDVNVLRKTIEEDVKNGCVPFFIGSTAGTTVVGGYDDFVTIHSISQEFNIWHHVDACWGGAAMLSSKLRHPCCNGIELSSSIAWNPHKMLGCALQTSIFLLSTATTNESNHKNNVTLKGVNATSASYLFQPDKLFTEYDIGDKTIQCGRKTDSFKLWLMWKSLGDAGISKSIEKCYDLKKYMVEKMVEYNSKSDNGDSWVFVVPPSCTNICFWYVPNALKPFNPSNEKNNEDDGRLLLHKVAPRIKAKLQKNGGALIGFQTDTTVQNGDINFFRMVFSSCDTVDERDIDQTLLDIINIGEEDERK